MSIIPKFATAACDSFFTPEFKKTVRDTNAEWAPFYGLLAAFGAAAAMGGIASAAQFGGTIGETARLIAPAIAVPAVVPAAINGILLAGQSLGLIPDTVDNTAANGSSKNKHALRL